MHAFQLIKELEKAPDAIVKVCVVREGDGPYPVLFIDKVHLGPKNKDNNLDIDHPSPPVYILCTETMTGEDWEKLKKAEEQWKEFKDHVSELDAGEEWKRGGDGDDT